MTSGVSPTVSAVLARFAPQVGAALEEMHAAAWQTLDPTLLELCRRRMAMLHGDAAELARVPPGAAAVASSFEKLTEIGTWPDSSAFTPAERACLAFTELFVAHVSGITQADVDPLLEQLGPSHAYAFVQALLLLDQQQRLRLAINRIFSPLGGPR